MSLHRRRPRDLSSPTFLTLAFLSLSLCSDFTPVCTTELAEAARLAPEFKKRNVKQIGASLLVLLPCEGVVAPRVVPLADSVPTLAGLSCNELGSHEKWVADINKFGSVDLSFPIIADPSRKIAQLYDMLDECVPRLVPLVTCRTRG